jgi:hypothetical protein
MLLSAAGHRLGSFIGLCISLVHLVGDVLLLLGADKVRETEKLELHCENKPRPRARNNNTSDGHLTTRLICTCNFPILAQFILMYHYWPLSYRLTSFSYREFYICS